MSEAMWDKLKDVYAGLPGWKGFDELSGCPIWFGKEGDDSEFLWASVEPSGLLVEGRLNDRAWIDWCNRFEKRATEVLGFAVRDAEE